MSTPHICPKCNGNKYIDDSIPYNAQTTGLPISKISCPVCVGTGIVWEPDSVFIPTCWTTSDSKDIKYVTYNTNESSDVKYYISSFDNNSDGYTLQELKKQCEGNKKG